MEERATDSVLAASELALVMIGNILGGTILVVLVHWFLYLRGADEGRFGKRSVTNLPLTGGPTWQSK